MVLHSQLPRKMCIRDRVTGGFLKRTDAFMFSIWFFTLYAMLNSMVFYSGNLAAKVIRDCGGYLEGKKRMLPYLILLLLCLLYTSLSNLTDQAAMEQVDKTDQIIFGLTGEHAQYIKMCIRDSHSSCDAVYFKHCGIWNVCKS